MISAQGLNQVVRGPAVYVTTHLPIAGGPFTTFRSALQLDADNLADPSLTFGLTLEFSRDDLSKGPPVNWSVDTTANTGCGVPSRAGGFDIPSVQDSGAIPQDVTAIRSTLTVPDGISIALGVLLSAS